MSNINPCLFYRMNTRRSNGQWRGGEAVGGTQNPPQAPAEGGSMPVNPVWLTDAEVRASLAQMTQAIMMLAKAMTAKVNWQDIQGDNPAIRSMDDSLRYFTRMNPHIFTGAYTSDDPQEFVDEVHKILVATGTTDIDKAELDSY